MSTATVRLLALLVAIEKLSENPDHIKRISPIAYLEKNAILSLI
ncbi:hypothetical protein N0824_03255 [Microcystis sp. 0824]|nr:hypothetical protein N0824_03255 [Microcystis sp. 0824]